MMAALFRTWATELRRDRVAFVLTFLLPVIFFSVFAVLFGGMGGGGATNPVTIAVVDEDGSEASRRLVEQLRRDKGLRVCTESGDPPAPLDRPAALGLVERGRVPIAVVIPEGFGEGFGMFLAGDVPAIELLADTSDPVAPQMVGGLLQGAAMTAAPDLMMQRGLEMFERYGGAFTEQQRAAVSDWLPMLRAATEEAAAGSNGGTDDAASSDGPAFCGPVAVKVVDVLGEKKTDRSRAVSLSASGIAVMFLLFMAAGGAGTLLEEQENGVLERLLSSRLTMGRLLLGKWAFLTTVGVVQVTVMFAWGMLFGLEFLRHLPGFAVMTVSTAAAGSALGLVLATACRTRAQLAGLSTIVILMMSALGGSMLPRVFMPEALRMVGLATFNGWALDGYNKVFWRELGAASLWPQVLVLAAMTAAFLVIARGLARRWEAA
jgi:ABC-2 type transport system permease protein